MTPIAPLITGFLREHMPVAQGRSPQTCESYAHALRLWLVFAGERRGLRPSQLCLEHLDAALVLDFLAHIEQQRGNGAAPATSGSPRSRPSCGMSSCAFPRRSSR